MAATADAPLEAADASPTERETLLSLTAESVAASRSSCACWAMMAVAGASGASHLPMIMGSLLPLLVGKKSPSDPPNAAADGDTNAEAVVVVAEAWGAVVCSSSMRASSAFLL